MAIELAPLADARVVGDRFTSRWYVESSARARMARLGG
jgi:hypothetical protein